jgi:hypothetical protein
MKRNVMRIFLVLSAVAALLPGRLQGQTPAVERTLIYSLEPGEEIMTAESMIALSADLDDVLLVLTRGPKGPFSVFRDGRKSKPFTDLKEAMKTAYEGRKDSSGKQRDCASYKPSPAPADALPSADDTGGRQVVRFKDKTFGPFVLIYSSRATPDGARAYYTANDKDGAVFGCTDGRRVSVGGLPGDYKFSPNGLNAATLCQGTLNFLDQKKLASLPPQQVAADMDKKTLYTIDGRKFGPFGGSFGESDYWFASTGNDLFYQVNDQLFRNGVVLLKTPWINPCSFYPSADGKAYALYNYEYIAFSDGQKFPSPLDILVFARNGRTIFKWITLENKKDLVALQRAM